RGLGIWIVARTEEDEVVDVVVPSVPTFEGHIALVDAVDEEFAVVGVVEYLEQADAALVGVQNVEAVAAFGDVAAGRMIQVCECDRAEQEDDGKGGHCAAREKRPDD